MNYSTSKVNLVLKHLEEIADLVIKINQIINPLSEPSKDIGSDQDQDHDLNQYHHPDQDQDQITRFTSLCDSVGVNLKDYDIRGIDRNINWLLDNKHQIRALKPYIEKMISGCPKKAKVGFKVPDEIPEDKRILGFEPELVDEKRIYLDERTYRQVRESIPGWKTMFSTFEAVCSSEMKSRVVTAYAIKAGIL